MHNNSAVIYFGAKTVIFLPVFLFFITTWCENKKIIIFGMLCYKLGELNGKY